MKNFYVLLVSATVFAASAFGQSFDYEVTAKKLDKSRNNLSPSIGSSSFNFSDEDIANLPQGQATPLNQVLQRAPSVAISAQNQLFVRGDHSNLQYRLNGVMLPDGINSFSQVLDTHFADNVDFFTGVLPAQYGYRTAAVVDIKTKSGSFFKKNRSEIMVGGNDTIGYNQQVGGNMGNLDYYIGASYLQSSRGIESPTPARKVNHDDTSQDNLFGYFSYVLDASKRLNFMLSNSTSRFEIPNNSNQEAEYELAGASANSSLLNEKQREEGRFASVSLQGVSDSEVDYQLSLTSRYTSLKFQPDFNGGLIFNGISSKLDRHSFNNALQGDFAREINAKNTVRFGFFASNDRVTSASDNWVFSVDDSGDQTSTNPFLISEGGVKNSQLYGAYIQNEWQALEKLKVNYGVRLDSSYSYVNESQISPRFGAVYDLNKDTKIHAGFARYFTPPPVSGISETNRQRFTETSNASESELNGKVKAERTSYYDVGISHKLFSGLTIALDGYYKQIKNLLDEHQFGNTLIYTPFNYEEGKAYGIEFKADYQKDNFSSYFNFAAARAYGKNIISGQYIHDAEELSYIANKYVRLDHAQNYTASVGAAYLLAGTKFSADALYGSGLSTGENNKNTMPSYWQINAAIARDISLPWIGKTNFRFAGVNLFDKVYRYSDGSGIGISASQYAMRRTFYLIVSKNF